MMVMSEGGMADSRACWHDTADPGTAGKGGSAFLLLQVVFLKQKHRTHDY